MHGKSVQCCQGGQWWLPHAAAGRHRQRGPPQCNHPRVDQRHQPMAVPEPTLAAPGNSALVHLTNCTCNCVSAGLSPCRDQCRDTATDVGACGACGAACPKNAYCTQGQCVCPPGMLSCYIPSTPPSLRPALIPLPTHRHTAHLHNILQESRAWPCCITPPDVGSLQPCCVAISEQARTLHSPILSAQPRTDLFCIVLEGICSLSL